MAGPFPIRLQGARIGVGGGDEDEEEEGSGEAELHSSERVNVKLLQYVGGATIAFLLLANARAEGPSPGVVGGALC